MFVNLNYLTIKLQILNQGLILFFLVSSFSISCSVSSDSGNRFVTENRAKELTKKMGPGFVVYSVTIVERALNGLPMPFVNEKILVFTKVGNSFPLT